MGRNSTANFYHISFSFIFVNSVIERGAEKEGEREEGERVREIERVRGGREEGGEGILRDGDRESARERDN